MHALSRAALSGIATLALTTALSATAFAQAQDAENEIVEADINSTLQLDIDTPFASPWALDNGTNTDSSLVLRAFANVSYGIEVNCDQNAAKNGNDNNLYEFDTTAGTYVTGTTNHSDGGAPKFITADLQIQEVGGPGAVAVQTVPATLAGVTAEPTTPVGGASHAVELTQVVDFGDASLAASGSVYHMELTFTILPGI